MKSIKLTTEQAKELYELNPEYRTNILSDFADEELGIDSKPKSWKELKELEGCYIDTYSHMIKCENSSLCSENKNIFTNEKYAQSALAYAQLSQLVEDLNRRRKEKINWKNKHQYKYIILKNHTTGRIFYEGWNSNQYSPLAFIDADDALFSMKYHKELWEQFFMVGVDIDDNID